VVIINF